MSQSFYPTADDILDDSLLCVRAVDPETSMTVTSTQKTKALRKLNLIVTAWQAKGMQVWCQKQGILTLVASSNSYTLGPSGDVNIARPLAVTQAWLHNISQNTDPIPLQIYGREEYNRFTSKATTGTPNTIWYDPGYDLPGGNSGASAKGTLAVYPTPDTTIASTYTLRFTYTRPIQDFSATTDSLDFPQEWYNAVAWNLASQICPMFGVPVMYWDRIRSQAKEELDNVSGWDASDGSMYILPQREMK